MKRSRRDRIGILVIGGSLGTLAAINCAFKTSGIYEAVSRFVPGTPFIARMILYTRTALGVILCFHMAGTALLRTVRRPGRSVVTASSAHLSR